MKCDDWVSFKWTVVRALHPVERNANVLSKILKKQSVSLDWSSLNVFDFEESNSIGINLIGLSGDRIIALKVAGWKYGRIVTLFFHEDRYYVVKNISRLWSSQISRGRRLRIFCDRCLTSFHSMKGFDKHLMEFRLWEKEIAEEEEKRRWLKESIFLSYEKKRNDQLPESDGRIRQ